MKVKFSSRSIAHIANIRDFLARENPQVAELVRLRILASIKRLQKFPGIGHPGRAEDTREVRVSGLPFIIVYRVKARITILAVFHIAQDR